MKKLRMVIYIAIILLFSYGFFSNVVGFTKNLKSYKYNFDNGVEIKGIKETAMIIQNESENLKKLKNSSLGDEFIEAYSNIIERLSSQLNSFKVMNYTGEKNLKQTDLYEMMLEYQKIDSLNLRNVFQKIGTVPLEEKAFTQHIYYMMLSRNYIYETLVDNYDYTKKTHKDDYTVETILCLFQEKLNTIHYLNNLIIKTGIISEDEEPTTNIESGEQNE